MSVSPSHAKEQDGKRSRRSNPLLTKRDITDKDNLFVFILSYIVFLCCSEAAWLSRKMFSYNTRIGTGLLLYYMQKACQTRILLIIKNIRKQTHHKNRAVPHMMCAIAHNRTERARKKRRQGGEILIFYRLYIYLFRIT